MDALLALWLAGMTVCAVVVALMQVACARVLKRSGRAADAGLDAMVAMAARRLGLKREVRVLVTTRPLGPAVFGIIRPTLLLPEPLLAALPSDQIEPILAHELVHIRRGDIAAGLAQVLAQIVWWFHPLVWWANRAAGRERERCCDEESLAGMGCEPASYARGLLKVLELRRELRPMFGLPGVRPVDLTRHRLEHIMTPGFAPRPRTSRRQWLALAAIALVLIPGASLPPRSASPDSGQHRRQEGLAAPPAKTATTRETQAEEGRASPDRLETDDTPKGNPSMKEELKKLQGSWRIVSLEMDGAPMPGGMARIVVQGETFTTTGMGATYKGTMTVDPSKTPKTLEMAFNEGPERGNKSLAIYEIDGDTWKICLGMTGKDRPKAFKTTAGSGHALEVLEREKNDQPAVEDEKKGRAPTQEAPKKDDKPAPAGKADKELELLQGEWSGVSLIVNGQELPAQFLQGWKRVVNGNETTVLNNGQVILKATFTIDSSKKPKTIDYTLSEGPDKGKMQLGIYELDGETTKYCFSPPGADRPAEFESKPGDGRIFGVWKKGKK